MSKNLYHLIWYSLLTSDCVFVALDFQGRSKEHHEKHPCDIVVSNQQGTVLHHASCHRILSQASCQCRPYYVPLVSDLRRGQIFYVHSYSSASSILTRPKHESELNFVSARISTLRGWVLLIARARIRHLSLHGFPFSRSKKGSVTLAVRMRRSTRASSYTCLSLVLLLFSRVYTTFLLVGIHSHYFLWPSWIIGLNEPTEDRASAQLSLALREQICCLVSTLHLKLLATELFVIMTYLAECQTLRYQSLIHFLHHPRNQNHDQLVVSWNWQGALFAWNDY